MKLKTQRIAVFIFAFVFVTAFGIICAVNVFAAKSPTSHDAPRATVKQWDDYGAFPTAYSHRYSSYYYDDDDDDDNYHSSSSSSSKKLSSKKSYSATSGGNRGISDEEVKGRPDGTVKLSSVSSESKKVTVGSTVKVDGKKYKVTAVSAGAFKNCKEMTTLILPKTINTIGKNAFKDCKNLKVIKLNITKAIKIVKGAFNGIDTSKMTIRVSKKMPAAQMAELIKRLRRAGYKGKVK